MLVALVLEKHVNSELFEGRLPLTQVKFNSVFFFVQQHFLEKFSSFFLQHSIIELKTKKTDFAF